MFVVSISLTKSLVLERSRFQLFIRALIALFSPRKHQVHIVWTSVVRYAYVRTKKMQIETYYPLVLTHFITQ